MNTVTSGRTLKRTRREMAEPAVDVEAAAVSEVELAGRVPRRPGFERLFVASDIDRAVRQARVESDDLAAEAESAALALNYLLGRNLRLLAEVARDLEREQSRASLGVVTAF